MSTAAEYRTVDAELATSKMAARDPHLKADRTLRHEFVTQTTNDEGPAPRLLSRG